MLSNKIIEKILTKLQPLDTMTGYLMAIFRENMGLDEIQQLQKLFQDSKHILITLPSQENGEAIGSALALFHYLEKKGKRTEIVADGFSLPKNLRFLDGAENIKPVIAHSQKFIIKVDITNTKIDSISYDVKDNWLSLYITPRQGQINKDNLRTLQAQFKYDLIVVLGSPDLQSLGNTFLNNTDLFYRTPVINIDNHASNEHFGQINLVDMSTAGTGEIIYRLLKKDSDYKIEKNTATQLLTSLILATKSFKTANVNPLTLGYASELMALGGDRDQIIRQLYLTRSLATLKLWGLALSQIKQYPHLKLASTYITYPQYHESGASENDIIDLAEEIITTTPEAANVLILYQKTFENKIVGILITDKNNNAKEILQSLNPEGDPQKIKFFIDNKTLSEAETEVIKILEQRMKK